ncbi:hypothetical protein PMI30_04960 [Pseudomonas sp. GM50]|nr:hypothetical protein PMI30_04960 [Pseudomonas sp. GM50]
MSYDVFLHRKALMLEGLPLPDLLYPLTKLCTVRLKMAEGSRSRTCPGTDAVPNRV